jgi:hypothetical protein
LQNIKFQAPNSNENPISNIQQIFVVVINGESQTKKASPGGKVTIQAAARTQGVSKGTVVHFLNNGKLTRIKEGVVALNLEHILLYQLEIQAG